MFAPVRATALGDPRAVVVAVRLVGVRRDELLGLDHVLAVDEPHRVALGAADVVLAGEDERELVVGGLEAAGVAELVLALFLRNTS